MYHYDTLEDDMKNKKIAFLDSNVLILMAKCNKQQKIIPSFEKNFQSIKYYHNNGYLISTVNLIIEHSGREDGSTQDRLESFNLKTKDILEKFKFKFLPQMKTDANITEKALKQTGIHDSMMPKHWKNFLIEVQPLLKEQIADNKMFLLCNKIIQIAKKHTEYEQYKKNEGYYTTSLIIITILCLLIACKNTELLKSNIFKFTKQGNYNPCNAIYDIFIFYNMIWVQQDSHINQTRLITNDHGLCNVLKIFDYPNNMQLDQSIKNLILSAAKYKALNYKNFNKLTNDQYNLIFKEILYLDSSPTTETATTQIAGKLMKNTITPFYDPSLSYADNYQQGPFGDFAHSPQTIIETAEPTKFLNLTVNLPFGIPAGPLLNANYIKAALAYGFDLCVYKTVRTKAHKSHPLPNILSIHPKGRLSHQLDTVLADHHYESPISITNSFGVPSFDPEIWQEDLADAVSAAKKGQYVIGSFQGTPGNAASIEQDYANAARLVAQTKAPILEANLSCPNEGVHKLLCFDFDKVERVAKAIKNAVPDTPLFLKLAYFANDEDVLPLLKKLDGVVDGFSTINTLSATPVDRDGNPALGHDRPTAGICGDAIRWAGLDMVKRLVRLREQLSHHFAIIGVGGVCSAKDYQDYIDAGADAVMSATGAMWNPNLAFEIKRSMNG